MLIVELLYELHVELHGAAVGVAVLFVFLPAKSRRYGNVFMWVALFTGNGMLMCLYSMEWFARRRCPYSSDVSTQPLSGSSQRAAPRRLYRCFLSTSYESVIFLQACARV